jgi:hypothetical protein
MRIFVDYALLHFVALLLGGLSEVFCFFLCSSFWLVVSAAFFVRMFSAFAVKLNNLLVDDLGPQKYHITWTTWRCRLVVGEQRVIDGVAQHGWGVLSRDGNEYIEHMCARELASRSPIHKLSIERKSRWLIITRSPFNYYSPVHLPSTLNIVSKYRWVSDWESDYAKDDSLLTFWINRH